METILVTGGAGYIGSHTCKLLSDSGFTPVVYDNLSTGHEANVKCGPLVRGDIRDTHLLRHTIKKWQPVCLIHFAAAAYVGESTVDPRKYYNNNVVGTLSVLDTCLDTKLRNVVFSSSCATYGIADQLPLTEQTIQAPVNPYGRTKLIGEMMLADYNAAYHLRYVALRYFNACGTDPEGDLSEWHEPDTHLIPRALLAAAGKILRLKVFGDDYQTADGTCIRDYVHVADLARAHVLAYRHLEKGGENAALNLGAGHGSSIREVLRAINQVTGQNVPIAIGPRREGDQPALYANASLAHRMLGFQPEYSDLETIVRTAAPSFGLEVRP